MISFCLQSVSKVLTEISYLDSVVIGDVLNNIILRGVSNILNYPVYTQRQKGEKNLNISN